MKGKFRILIIENQSSDAEAAKKHIAKAIPDCNIIIIDSLKDLLKNLKTFKPDIVISDFILNDFDGIEVINTVLKNNPLTPVIILTGSINEETAAKCLKSGATDYITKDQINRLGNSVINALKLRESRERNKRMHNALVESELHFKTLANSGYALIWTSGLDKSCNFFNQPWLDFRGRSLEEETGFGWTEGIHPDDLQKLMDDYSTAFDKREKFSIDYRLKRHDGEYRWINDTGMPINNSKGEFIGYIGHCFDIHDRKIAEERLKKEEQFLANVFNSVQDGISILDKDLNIIKTNWIMQEWYKESIPLVGKKCFEAYHNRNEVCEICPTIRCIKSGKPESDIVRGYPESKQWLELFSYPLKDNESGEITGVVEFVRDITARKIAEEDLQQSEKDYRTLFDNIAQGFVLHEIIFDNNHVPIDFIFLKANPAFEKQTGMKVSDIIGKTGKEVMPDLKSHWLHLWWDIAVTGGCINYENYSETFGKHLDIWVVSPKKGQFAMLFNDITEKKKSQEALKQSERNYREIFNSTAEGIIIQDIETGKIIDANKAAMDIFDCKTKDDLKSRSLLDFIKSNKDNDECICGDLLDIFSDVVKEGKQKFICDMKSIKEEEFRAEISLKKANIGGKTVILGVLFIIQK
ncbi:MAG: PAS domain S-box protein [Bacteroidota bacterium]